MKLAVIPARGGSKRIPRKNIKMFCGKPIIAWSIETASKSGCFDRMIVSTDDAEVAAVAKDLGAEVPFIRPAELADDYSGTIPVIAHAIGWFQQQGLSPEEVCCIYATAPFIQAENLNKGLNILLNTDCSYVLAVTRFAFPIQRALRINTQGRVEMLNSENFGIRSQDLEVIYHDAAQFYWGNAKTWQSGKSIFSSDSCPIVLPYDEAHDIDTPEDWSRAELLYANMHKNSL